LIYIGVGNGTPWNRAKVRGDALYLSSIVALKAIPANTLGINQTTPGDEWDYDACSPLILADLEIRGTKRGVILQAPKNGFFYVVGSRDRCAPLGGSLCHHELGQERRSFKPAAGHRERGTLQRIGQAFRRDAGTGRCPQLAANVVQPGDEVGVHSGDRDRLPVFSRQERKQHELAWNTGDDFNSGSLPQDAKIKGRSRAASKTLGGLGPGRGQEVWRAELGHP